MLYRIKPNDFYFIQTDAVTFQRPPPPRMERPVSGVTEAVQVHRCGVSEAKQKSSTGDERIGSNKNNQVQRLEDAKAGQPCGRSYQGATHLGRSSVPELYFCIHYDPHHYDPPEKTKYKCKTAVKWIFCPIYT